MEEWCSVLDREHRDLAHLIDQANILHMSSSFCFEAPTNSFALAPSFHTWKVGMALMPQVAATLCGLREVGESKMR